MSDNPFRFVPALLLLAGGTTVLDGLLTTWSRV